MEINHWAKLVSAKLVKSEAVNATSDLIILGHYGGFSTYKQDGWYGYAMKISDFVAEFSGITDIFAGPGIVVAGTGPTRTIAVDGTFGGGTNFNVQPSGPIQVSKNTNPVDGNLITITNLDTLNISALSLVNGLNWQAEWDITATYSQDDVVWYEDPITNTYYTYWAYNGTVPPGSPLPGAGQASNTYWARLGLEGPTGNPGFSTAVMKLYQWSVTQPTTFPTDNSIYTWATGAFTSPSSIGSWSQTISSSPVPGQTLWELTQQYTAYPIGSSQTITWSSTSPKAIAYFGTDGINGTDGKSVLSGSGAPNNSLGENGDFYIETDSPNYTMYGPKAGGNWTTNPTKNLKGDTGPQGAPGGAVVTIGTGTSSAIYTILATDASNLIKINTTSNNVVIQVPDDLTSLANGSQIMFAWDQRDSGLVYSASFLALGTTVIKSANGMLNLRTQYSAATLIKITNTEYYLVGDIAPY